MTVRSIALFIAATLAETGGAYLVWIGLREHKGALVVVLGMLALALYGVVATLQPSHEFGRVLAAYGGVVITGSLLWGIVFDGFHPRPLRPQRRHHLPTRRRRHHVRPLDAGLTTTNRRYCHRNEKSLHMQAFSDSGGGFLTHFPDGGYRFAEVRDLPS